MKGTSIIKLCKRLHYPFTKECCEEKGVKIEVVLNATIIIKIIRSKMNNT